MVSIILSREIGSWLFKVEQCKRDSAFCKAGYWQSPFIWEISLWNTRLYFWLCCKLFLMEKREVEIKKRKTSCWGWNNGNDVSVKKFLGRWSFLFSRTWGLAGCLSSGEGALGKETEGARRMGPWVFILLYLGLFERGLKQYKHLCSDGEGRIRQVVT